MTNDFKLIKALYKFNEETGEAITLIPSGYMNTFIVVVEDPVSIDTAYKTRAALIKEWGIAEEDLIELLYQA